MSFLNFGTLLEANKFMSVKAIGIYIFTMLIAIVVLSLFNLI